MPNENIYRQGNETERPDDVVKRMRLSSRINDQGDIELEPGPPVGPSDSPHPGLVPEPDPRSGDAKPGLDEPAPKSAVEEIQPGLDESSEPSAGDEKEADSADLPHDRDPRWGYIELGPDEPAPSQTSERKREANRRNAQLSTGPKTERGKDTSRLNSLKHGLLARAIPVRDMPYFDEREEENLSELLNDFWSEWRPEGSFEEWLVEQMACIFFQFSRVYRFQRAAIYIAVEKERVVNTLTSNNWTDELHRAKWEQCLLADEAAVGKIVRYESMLDREFYRCLDQLDRRQQRRRANGFTGSEPAVVPSPDNEQDPRPSRQPSLTQERRREIARKAVRARWAKARKKAQQEEASLSSADVSLS